MEKDTTHSTLIIKKLGVSIGALLIFLGVPVKLGKNGIEQIIELKLNEEELELLHTSEGHVRQVMEVFDNMNL